MSGATSLSSPAEAFTSSQTPRYGSFANVSYSATQTRSAIITSEPEVKLQTVPYQRHGLVMYCKMLYTDHLDHFQAKGIIMEQQLEVFFCLLLHTQLKLSFCAVWASLCQGRHS